MGLGIKLPIKPKKTNDLVDWNDEGSSEVYPTSQLKSAGTTPAPPTLKRTKQQDIGLTVVTVVLFMQEKDVLNLFSEVRAENEQLLSQLEIAKDIKTRV